MNQEHLEHSSELDLREFFDAYDRDNPYMISAVQELYELISKKAPEVLSRDTEWFHTWTWGGKRDLLTGLIERDGKLIHPQ